MAARTPAARANEYADCLFDRRIQPNAWLEARKRFLKENRIPPPTRARAKKPEPKLSFELVTGEEYRRIRKSRTPTLMRWWKELNSWRWPKEIENEESRDVRDCPRRRALMIEIAACIGLREVILKRK